MFNQNTLNKRFVVVFVAQAKMYQILLHNRSPFFRENFTFICAQILKNQFRHNTARRSKETQLNSTRSALETIHCCLHFPPSRRGPASSHRTITDDSSGFYGFGVRIGCGATSALREEAPIFLLLAFVTSTRAGLNRWLGIVGNQLLLVGGHFRFRVRVTARLGLETNQQCIYKGALGQFVPVR